MKTKEEKLKAVTEDIRSKLPRLMQLEKGCWINTKYGKAKIISKINHYLTCLDVDSVITEYSERYLNNIKGFKIIGKEPMLNDVMQSLRKSHCGRFIFLTEGTIIDDDLEYDRYVSEWDLSKPYLYQQSEELINFLYELL